MYLLVLNILEPVCDQVQMGSAFFSFWRRKNASGAKSLNDLPDEILLKILSHFGPEELCCIIAKVCKSWNILAKDLSLWKTLSYKHDYYNNIFIDGEVRCTTLLAFRTHMVMNFPNLVY
jgi:hypothetical protein